MGAIQMLANMKDNSPLLPDKHGLGCTLPSCLHVKDVAKFSLVTNGPEGTMTGEFEGPMPSDPKYWEYQGPK